MCAVIEGFGGEGPVNNLGLQSDYAAHIIPDALCSIQSAAWSVTWWNVVHYASSKHSV